MNTATDRLSEVKANIAAAEREAGHSAGSVTLVAVSKTFDADAVRPILAAGQRVFGENRVQEAQGKWPALRQAFPGIELLIHIDPEGHVDEPGNPLVEADEFEKLDERTDETK